MKYLFIFACSLFCLAASAENFYISNAGNDSNPGTSPSSPWRTLEKVSSFKKFRPGDNIFFKRGDTFYGRLEITSSGTQGNPITIGAYGSGNNPVITGFTKVSAWVNKGSNIWESAGIVSELPACNIVTIGGANVPMGRFPNSGYATVQSHAGHTSLSGNVLSGGINWKDAEAVVKSSQWTLDRAKITSHSGNTITFKAVTHQIKDGFGFFIQNHPKTLDSQNEWYYDPSSGKILVYSIGQPKDVNVASVENLITIHGKYLVFENITITGANSYAFFNDWPDMKSPVIQNCNISFSGIDGIKVARTPNITIANNKISNSNNIGIFLFNSVHSPVITNNEIVNTAIFPGVGQSGDISYTGIVSLFDNATINNNRIIHTGYNSIFCVGDSFEIRNNFIDTFCTVLQDGGGIHTNSKDRVTYGKKIIGNVIINGVGNAEGTNETELLATGIYLDDNTAHIEVAGNSVAFCAKGGIFAHNSYNLNIHDNTLFGNEYQFVTQYDNPKWKTLSGSTIKKNIYFSKSPSQLCGYFTSYNYNFQSWGNVDSNYYVRPIGSDFLIRTLSWQPYNEKYFSVSSWYDFSKYDAHSSKSPVTIPDVTYTTTGSNKVSNGTFNENISGVSKWSVNGNLVASWNKDKLDGGSLELSYTKVSATNTSPIFSIPVGAVESSKQYVLKFSSIGKQKNQTIHAFLKIKTPYKELTVRIPAIVTTVRNEHEILFSFPKSAPAAELTFTWNDKELNETFWIDNIEFYEASSVTKSDPNDYIRFEYNATPANKVISLQGGYVDAKGKPFSGQVTLAPYSSMVFIKTSKKKSENPIADAGNDQTITLPVTNIKLAGKGSSPSAKITGYKWTKVQGAGAAITDADMANTSVTGLQEGVYLFELKVTDEYGMEGRDTIQIKVLAAANKLPVANAGSDKTITLPLNKVTLSGSGTDADGKIGSWQWTKISGPSTFRIIAGSSSTTEVDNLAEGVYRFQLTVKDEKGGEGKDTVQVTVLAAANKLPVANAGSDKTITLPLNKVTLSGSGTDADGKIGSWQWTKISGPSTFRIVNGSSSTTEVDNLSEGVYRFQLIVKDDKGGEGKDTVQVTVLAAANKLPVANAGSDKTITLPVNIVTLSGSGKDDDGEIKSWVWTKISGPQTLNIVNAASPVTDVSQMEEGIYLFELKVTDNRGGVGKDTVRVTVNAAANIPPVADAGRDLEIELPKNSAILNGSGKGPDGKIVGYEWKQISGPGMSFIQTPLSGQTSVSGLIAGTYVFELTVTDNTGAIARDTMTLTVAAARESVNYDPIRFFPNPVQTIGVLEINSKLAVENLVIVLVDANGKTLMKKNIEKFAGIFREMINMSNYSKGVYYLTVYYGNTAKQSLRIIKM